MPQCVLRTAGGASIYEDEEESFFEERADYYYDASAREAAVAKVKWVTRFSPRGARLLDVGANAGLFVAEAGHLYDAADARSGCFDVVTMFDVIEHLRSACAM